MVIGCVINHMILLIFLYIFTEKTLSITPLVIKVSNKDFVFSGPFWGATIQRMGDKRTERTDRAQ